MNYEKSQEILEKIKKADKILVNCHRSPDPDSVGSALAMAEVLKVGLGKNVKVICPDKIPSNLEFLYQGFQGQAKVEQINVDGFDFGAYDLFIVLDSSSWDMVTGDAKVDFSGVETVVIDHHVTNENFGEINLVDTQMGSCAELLYFVFQDWGFSPDINSDHPKFAEALLTGIIGDTGAFKFSSATAKTFKVARELMEGSDANKDEIIFNLYQNFDINFLHFVGEILSKSEVDEEGGFTWSAIPFEVYKKYEMPQEAKHKAASEFLQSIKGTRFGVAMVEIEKGTLSVSLRARKDFDVSKVASALGGGGHEKAAGARVKGVAYDAAVTKVLEVARKYAQKN